MLYYMLFVSRNGSSRGEKLALLERMYYNDLGTLTTHLLYSTIVLLRSSPGFPENLAGKRITDKGNFHPIVEHIRGTAPMLESLNSIDVQELQDAHREANEVCVSINQMIANIAQMRDESIGSLCSTIWHQDSVDQCTVSAVQFLIERLQSDSVQDKDELLLLLAYVARGNSYANIEQYLSHEFVEPDDSEEEDASSQKLQWRQNAYDAVAQGIPTYLDLLEHQEPNVRTSAAYALACFKEHSCHIVSLLLSRIHREEDELAKSSKLLCLGALGESSICQQLLTEIKQEQATPLVKLAAAMALARLSRDNIPAEAIHVLIDSIVEPESTKDLYIELPWAETDVVGDACYILYTLGSRPAQLAVPILIEALETTNPHSSLRVVDALLHLAFNGKLVNADLTIQTLTPEQRLVLTTIANSNCAWVIDILNIGKAS